MTKATLLTIEKFDPGEEAKYQLTSPREIQLTLQALAKKRSLTIIYFDEARRFVKSMLLSATDKGIWLDTGPDTHDNRLLLNSPDITLVTLYQGSKIQFTSQHPELGNFDSHPAFHFPLPVGITRLQRREFYRLPISTETPLKCVIPPADYAAPSIATIVDISVGGIALKCKEKDFRLEEGLSFENCQIELPGSGMLTATIQIKNLIDVPVTSNQSIKHAGCEFVKMDVNMSMLLQRYIGLMQSKVVQARK